MPEDEIQQAQPQQPQDLASKKEQYAALESELNNLASDESFIAFMVSKITPEMEDLFFENREQFLTQIFKTAEDWAQDFATRKGELDNLGGEISLEEGQQAIKAAIAQFMQENPEANIDEIFAFFESLDEQTKAQLSQLDPLSLLQKLYELMQAGEQTQDDTQNQQQNIEQENDKPPTRLQGVAAESSNLSARSLPMDRF